MRTMLRKAIHIGLRQLLETSCFFFFFFVVGLSENDSRGDHLLRLGVLATDILG